MQNTGDFGFFEGAEKLLEVWFKIPAASLKDIRRCDWDRVLDVVGAKIVSFIKTDVVDSYVLSESSLFVWSDHFILKTCGITTLLLAYPEIEKLVSDMCPGYSVIRAFYSHKGYLRPNEQKFPHINSKMEYRFLKKMFPGGRLSTFKTSKNELTTWIIYSYFNNISFLDKVVISDHANLRVELMMYGLDETRFQIFSADSYKDPENEMREASKINKILENALINDKVFYPYGYSVNGVKNETYFTIHVTPQPECSYASFEINQNSPELVSSCLRCLEIFQPKNFCLAVVCHENVVANPHMLITKLKSVADCKKVSSYKNNNYYIYYAWF